jgi:hypothetical protein
MKSRMELWQCALEELGARCSVSTTDLRLDIETVVGRTEHEGDAFFGITLPKFGKDFERALSSGGISKDLFVGWGRRSLDKRSLLSSLPIPDLHDNADLRMPSGSPKFLGGFMDRVFDPRTGLLLDAYPALTDNEVCIDSVHAIRQLTLMFGKTAGECSPDRNESAVKAFVKTDQEIADHLRMLCSLEGFPSSLVKPLKDAVRVLFAPVLSMMEKDIYDGLQGNLLPAHGPGATADKLTGNQKFYLREWTDRLESLFPFGEWALPSYRSSYLLPEVIYRSPEEERPVKVTLVPKTPATPRIIAIEPTCMQFMQQAVSRLLVERLEDADIGGNIGRHFIGFSQQWPNQALAQIGSEDGSLATLDLSEASDRVPNWLVEAMFEDFPWFSTAIQVCRSLRAQIPGGDILILNKYASMGSALTFPIEAMVFTSIVFASMFEADKKVGEDNNTISRAYVNTFKDRVRIYGDDIIIPADYAAPVVEDLENLYGFKVNRSKSFWTGKFRESCGKEYYDGEDVSIVRYRRDLPRQLAHVEEIMSAVSTRNQFYQTGMWKSAALLDDVLGLVLKGWYPYISPDSSILGRVSYLIREPVFGRDTHYWDRDIQVPLIRGYRNSAKPPINSADGEAALLKCLLSPEQEPSALDHLMPKAESDHLTRSGRPRAASIKLVKSPFH